MTFLKRIIKGLFAAGFATPLIYLGLRFTGQYVGSIDPNPGIGDIFPIDVSAIRSGPKLIVYVTHGYSMAYAIAFYLFLV